MTTEAINDWVVRVGFDDSKVLQGAKRVNSVMQKIGKVQRTISNSQQKSLNKNNEALRKQNSLESKRLQLLKSINRAKDLGLKTQGFTQSLRGANVARLEQRRLELEKAITNERKRQKDLQTTARRQSEIKSAQKPITRPAVERQVLSERRRFTLERGLDTQLRKVEKAFGATSNEARQTRIQIDRVRSSMKSVKTEADLSRLINQITLLKERTQQSTSALRQQQKAMNAQKFAAKGLQDSLNNLARSYISVFAVIEGGRAFFQVGSEFDSLNASLLAASGSTEQASQDFQFIRNTALRLGVQLNQVAHGYRQIGAAGRFSNLTTEQTNEVFLAATEASRAFGLSADRAGLVYLAFSQILSKGKVSQEELRRQLGEQLPGAMSIAAKAMNVTTGELEDMIKTGISAEEFLPRFSKELRAAVTDSGALEASLNSITAAQQRFTSSIQLLTVEAFNVGGKQGVVFFFDQLTKATKSLQPLFRVLGRIFGIVGAALGGILRVVSLITRPFTTMLDILFSITEQFTIGEKGLVNYSNSMLALMGPLGTMIKAFQILAALILIPLGAVERLLNKFEELRNELKFDSPKNIADSLSTVAIQAAGSALKTFGADPATIDKSVRAFDFGEVSRRINNQTLPTMQTGAVNSNNNLNLTVTTNGNNDSEEIVRVIDEWWTDVMRVGN